MSDGRTMQMQNFEEIWRRVQGGGERASAENQHRNEMEQLIESEANGEALYRAAARLAEGKTAQALRAMAMECGANSKKIQTAYFLKTGDTFIPGMEKLPRDGLLGYLRRAWQRENRLENEYLAAAAAGESEATRLLCGDFSIACAKRREKISELVSCVFG